MLKYLCCVKESVDALYLQILLTLCLVRFPLATQNFLEEFVTRTRTVLNTVVTAQATDTAYGTAEITAITTIAAREMLVRANPIYLLR